jgi:hypothetical protein
VSGWRRQGQVKRLASGAASRTLRQRERWSGLWHHAKRAASLLNLLVQMGAKECGASRNREGRRSWKR